MIELTFATAEGPMVIQICAPAPTSGGEWPWAIEVRTNGRPQTLVGGDPLEALRLAVAFATAYLSGREGLDPPVEPIRAPDHQTGGGS